MELPEDPLTLASSSLPATPTSPGRADEAAMQAVTPNAQAVAPAPQAVAPEAQAVADEAKAVAPDERPVADDTQAVAKEVQAVAPEAKAVSDDAPPVATEAQAAANDAKAVASTTPGATGTNAAATPATPQWGPVQIVVYKARRSLALYRFGNFYREYPVVLGMNPEGRKRHAHDARTPEGLYHVVKKRAHERWQYFLDLDYPNDKDRRIYTEEKGAGRIPDEDGSPFAIGGSIGIHGNDRADQQAAGIDWTKGCIALEPSDIAEIEALTPVGTPVWIVR